MITDAMKAFGYFETRTFEIPNIGKQWINVEYAMNVQNLINQYFSDVKYLYHIAPQKFDGRIKKYGLVPKNGNLLYDYPDRIYMFECEDEQGEVFNLTADDFLIPIRFLFAEKKKSHNQYVNDYLFSVYRINVAEIYLDTKFHIDMTQKNIPILNKGYLISVFTEDNIKPSAIEKLFEVELRH